MIYFSGCMVADILLVKHLQVQRGIVYLQNACNFRTLYWNANFTQMLRYTPEAAGSNPSKIF